MCNSVYFRNNLHIEGNLAGQQTLIFAHGFGTDQTSWEEVKNAFAQNYKLVLYDQVGAGGSDLAAYSPAKYASLNGYAQDLLEICHSLKLKAPIFIGHSASCITGLLAATIEPEAFSRLILLAPSPRYLNDLGYVGGFEQKDLDELYQQMEQNYYSWASGFSKLAMGNHQTPELADRFAETICNLRPDIALHVIKSIFQSDIRDILPGIDHETLIVQSSNDIAVAPEVGPYMEAHLRNGSLVNINAEGHLPHISAANEVIHTIESFLEREK